MGRHYFASFFFFNDTATTEIYTLSLHDALPISSRKKSIVGSMSLLLVRRDSRCDSGCVGIDPLLCSPLDRKSTRLNSSHSQISYAVFCLKKKKKKLHSFPYVLQPTLCAFTRLLI